MPPVCILEYIGKRLADSAQWLRFPAWKNLASGPGWRPEEVRTSGLEREFGSMCDAGDVSARQLSRFSFVTRKKRNSQAGPAPLAERHYCLFLAAPEPVNLYGAGLNG
jgi:hypothetical protein